MGRFALGNAVAVAALLMGFPAGADDLISHHPELLTSSPDNRWWQATKIAKSAAEYACMEVLHKSAVGEAASTVGKAMTKGRGEFVEFLVDGMADIAGAKFCDAMGMKSPTPGLNPVKLPDFNFDAHIAGPKTLAQAWCSLNESNGRACAGLPPTPFCTPGQSSVFGPCGDMPSLAWPK
jgi:hypothetical protein